MRPKLPPRWLLLIFSSILFSLSFEPSPFWFFIYFSVPLFIAATHDLSFREGFKSGYMFGMLVSFFTLYWVVYVTITGVILLIFIHALYYALIGGILSASTQRYGLRGIITLPVIWVGIEYLRSLSQVSFPWLNISYTQASNLPIVQLSELSGDATVTLFILIVGVVLYLAYREVRNPLKASLLFASVIVFYMLVYIWGMTRIHPTKADFLVSALQGNIPIKEKWQQGSVDQSFKIYEQLTADARKDSAELVVWPETAAPSYLAYDAPYASWLEKIAKTSNVDILTGALHLVRNEDASTHIYNSAFFASPKGLDRTPYNKEFLVPFGEHMPYADKIGVLAGFRDFVKTKWGFDISDFEPGDSMVTFESHGRKFGALICFEVVYPELVRLMVLSGADFLAAITNDDWFGRTAGPYQHAAIPVFRAVENRIWIVRSANTGISEIINPNGMIVAKTKLGERTHLTGWIGHRMDFTLFQKYGSLLSKFCFVLSLMLGIILVVSKGRHAAN